MRKMATGWKATSVPAGEWQLRFAMPKSVASTNYGERRKLPQSFKKWLLPDSVPRVRRH
jgi:hypothetical protein